jgi:hypothetical protein
MKETQKIRKVPAREFTSSSEKKREAIVNSSLAQQNAMLKSCASVPK